MVQAENLYFSYTGAPPFLLENINLSIKDGEYVSVVGDNGSGKSTLLRLMLGFLKPTGGKIGVFAKRVGYVPQKSDFANAGFPITVYEALNSYRKLLKIRQKSAIGEVLRKVGLSGLSSSLTGNLSGGQGRSC